MKKNIILVDADDVLLAWTGPFINWMNNVHGLPMVNFGAFDIPGWFNISREASDNYVKEFNEAQVHIQPPFRDAMHGVDYLKENGYVLHVISSFGDTPILKKKRADRLVELFDDAIWQMDILDYGESKSNILFEYQGTGLFFIDDMHRHYASGLKHELKPLLMMNEFNEYQKCDVEQKNKVYSWRDIINRIESDGKI